PSSDPSASHGGKGLRLDPFGEPQTHPQESVGRFLAREHLVGDEAVAFLLHAREPTFRALFRRGGVAVAVDVEPAVRARPDAGIFMHTPINEIVPALGAWPRMV